MALLVPRTTPIRCILVVAIATCGPAKAEGPVLDEYQVKAAFLFNFAKFVEWPPTSFKSADEPFAICVLGSNPFGSMLEDVVRGRTVGHRAFVVRELSTIQQAARCHVLFISGSEQKRTRSLMDDLKGFNVLTVGETDDFLARGGVVAFKLKDSRVRIEIDPDFAERSKLRISSKLLSLAEVTRR